MIEQPNIEVNLIGATSGIDPNGLAREELLIYTKLTRLQQGKKTREAVMAMTMENKQSELAYMADTIPSSWEMIAFVFEILNVTRAFTHQLVRTRTGSYAQQTMRVLDKKDFTYRVPPKFKEPKAVALRTVYENCMADIQEYYDWLIEKGAAAEDARGVLPTNIHTNIIAAFNLRTLAEMAQSRTGARTQDEYREVIDLMLCKVVELCPWAAPFLFPEKGRHIKALEELLSRAAQFGSMSQEEKIQGFKHLDALRKGKL